MDFLTIALIIFVIICLCISKFTMDKSGFGVIYEILFNFAVWFYAFCGKIADFAVYSALFFLIGVLILI